MGRGCGRGVSAGSDVGGSQGRGGKAVQGLGVGGGGGGGGGGRGRNKGKGKLVDGSSDVTGEEGSLGDGERLLRELEVERAGLKVVDGVMSNENIGVSQQFHGNHIRHHTAKPDTGTPLAQCVLLEKCRLGATQNHNDSFNSLAWQRCIQHNNSRGITCFLVADHSMSKYVKVVQNNCR